MNNRNASIITGLALAIVLVVVNVLANRHFVRLDLTENKAYTLSSATKKILSELDDVVLLRIYFSDNLPPQLTHVRRGVLDLAEEYQQYGGKNFTTELRDLEDPQTERELLMLGIEPMQVNVVQRDKQEVARIFMGMVMIHGDKQEVIHIDPRAPTQHLEESLTGSVVKLTQERMPVVAWLGNQTSIEGEGKNIIQSLIGERYKVEPIEESISVLDPSKTDVLVLAGPRNLSVMDLLHIDDYLGLGGKVIALIDNVTVGERFMGVAVDSGLEPLLTAYGVNLSSGVVADATNAYAAFRSGYVTYSVPYPFWPSIRSEGLNRSYPPVSQLEALVLPWAGALEISKEIPSSLKIEKIVTSSSFAGITPGEPPYSLDPQDAGLVLPRNPVSEKVLALVVKGKFPSAFETNPELKLPKNAKQLPRGEEAGELVVVSTSHFLEDRFVGQQQFAEGVDFFANIVDHLSWGDALVGIRSRPVMSRPIPANLSTTAKLTIRYGNMIGVPLLIIIGGFGGVLIRRRRWQKLHDTFSKKS